MAEDDDDDDVAAGFHITDLDPDNGSSEGGYMVTIEFDGSITVDEDELAVAFGAASAEVLAITADSVVVMAPPGCAAGDVDVVVSSPYDGSDSEEFEYEAYGEGLVGAVYGVYRSMNFQSSRAPAVEGNAEAGFFEPDGSIPLAHLPPLGTCSTNVTAPSGGRTYYSVGAALTVTGAAPFAMSWSAGDQGYTAASLGSAHLPAPATYSITGAVDPNGCALDLTGVVEAPAPFVVTAPLLDPEYADCWYMANVCSAVDSMAFVEWQPPYDPRNRVIIQLVHSSDPSAPSLTCHAADDGSFVLQQQHLLPLTEGLYTVLVSRYRVTETELAPSGATAYGVHLDTRIASVFVYLTDQLCQYCY